MSQIEIAAFAVSLCGLLTALLALRRATRVEAALASEKVERLSASQQAGAAARLAAGRIDAIEQRVGRGRRLTPAKRERALELLAAGASEPAVARELELREAEVAVLVRLRARVGTAAGV